MTDKSKFLEILMRAADKVAPEKKLTRSYKRTGGTVYAFIKDNYNDIETMRKEGYSWAVIAIAILDSGLASGNIESFTKNNITRTYSSIKKREEKKKLKAAGNKLQPKEAIYVDSQTNSLAVVDQESIRAKIVTEGGTNIVQETAVGAAVVKNEPVKATSNFRKSSRVTKEDRQEAINIALYGRKPAPAKPREVREETEEEKAAYIRKARWNTAYETMYWGVTVQPGSPCPKGPPDHWDGTSRVYEVGIFENEIDKIKAFDESEAENKKNQE